MDVEDFTRNVMPRKNGSQLLPFRKEIGNLKHQGYSDEQIREWLARNSVTVSRENVRKFIKRHLPNFKQKQQEEPSVNSAQRVADDQSSATNLLTEQATGDTRSDESRIDRLRRLTEEQRSEAEKTRFKHDKTGNNH